MTAVSCLAIGFGFLVAVALLVLAGVLIGFLIPGRLSRRRRRRPPSSFH
jgi:hypothetical protein